MVRNMLDASIFERFFVSLNAIEIYKIVFL
jgi:hypothetical protein